MKLSADGVPFLLHDDTLERTTPERGVAGLREWRELSCLDAGGWHSREYAGEPLPSLRAIARYVQGNGFALDLEIKPTPGQEHATGVAVGAACLQQWAEGAPGLLFSSFRPDALQGALESAPQIPRALLLETLWPGWWNVAQALGCVAVITQHKLMDPALIGQLHGTDLRALCYTVNDLIDAKRLLALGVDGLITDAVDHFVPGAGSVQDGR